VYQRFCTAYPRYFDFWKEPEFDNDAVTSQK
jgi:hypothetical protein